jgi:hypothetical protein
VELHVIQLPSPVLKIVTPVLAQLIANGDLGEVGMVALLLVVVELKLQLVLLLKPLMVELPVSPQTVPHLKIVAQLLVRYLVFGGLGVLGLLVVPLVEPEVLLVHERSNKMLPMEELIVLVVPLLL